MLLQEPKKFYMVFCASFAMMKNENCNNLFFGFDKKFQHAPDHWDP